MLSFLKKYPDLKEFSLKAYQIELPFDRLKLGVDNVRYDVYISPEFKKTAESFIFELIIKHSQASPQFIVTPDYNWEKEIAEFERQCIGILTDAINRAKSLRNIQIDFLAQIALIKMLIDEMPCQFEEAVNHFKTVIRQYEISQKSEETLKSREEVSSIAHRKSEIITNAGTELFRYVVEAQQELKEMRLSNFGAEAVLPDELFANPILQSAVHNDGFMLIDKYVLVGHRVEDPVNYNTLMNILKSFLKQLSGEQSGANASAKTSESLPDDNPLPDDVENFISPADLRIEGIIKDIDNIDKLFNCFQTMDAFAKLEKQKNDPVKKQSLKQTEKNQSLLLNLLYKRICQENMIEGIVAAYKMQLVFSKYCPPLSPQECLQYLVIPKSRKNTIQKLKRFKKYYGRAFPLRLLKRTASEVKSTPKRIQKILLIRFLKDFARYHRDLSNYRLVRNACDCINLPSDEKIIKLSRDNHTLHEFVLSHEAVDEKKAIINHVVLKADIRGSSKIIEQMKSQNLNPASNFSLNFFDPISKILSLYGAVKVFIEGDAIILAIFEHEGTPGRWYGVARACGLAINILNVIKKYNAINQKNGLPSLELGVGIGYNDAPPTFFYDGSNQIMISPAINVADQLSGCNKALRARLAEANLPFNVYVFQPVLDKATSLLSDIVVLRYNVRGIELAPEAFEKLDREIHLKRFETQLADIHPVPMVLYTGTYPTVAGNYQRLVVREAGISEVSLTDLSPIRETQQKFYEVCTNQRVYDHVKQLL